MGIYWDNGVRSWDIAHRFDFWARKFLALHHPMNNFKFKMIQDVQQRPEVGKVLVQGS